MTRKLYTQFKNMQPEYRNEIWDRKCIREIDHADKWYMHKPKLIQGNGKFKFFSDFGIEITAGWPTKNYFFLNWFGGFCRSRGPQSKNFGKINNYLNLSRELK